jgi:tRNA-(ms[2]io[6]A)-hydroxylase
MIEEAANVLKFYQKHIKDPELAKFYRDLMISEAGHYTYFSWFSKICRQRDVDKR